MNTSYIFPRRKLSLALGLIATFAASHSANAGPGPDYWRGQKSTAPAAERADMPTPCDMTCADSKTVPITETKNAWHNGRGPLQTVTVGTKQVCNSCRSTTTVMKPSFANGRGPMRAIAVSTPHTCRISYFTNRG